MSDRVPILAMRLTEDVAHDIGEHFGEESIARFHRGDISVRYGDDRAPVYTVRLDLVRICGEKSTTEVLFRVRKPTANSARVAFRRKLKEVGP